MSGKFARMSGGQRLMQKGQKRAFFELQLFDNYSTINLFHRMDDEQMGRILNCVTSCWPEFNFSMTDINGKKPMTGERFRELLCHFLKGFLGGNYHLPGVSALKSKVIPIAHVMLM